MATAKSDKILPGMTKEEIATSPLPLPGLEGFDEQEKAAYVRVLERSERLFRSFPSQRDQEYRLTPLHQGLVQSPRLAELWSDLGDFFQTSEQRGTISSRDREIALLALAPTLTNAKTDEYPITDAWIIWAVSAGVAPQDIRSIIDGRPEQLSAEDRQLFDFVRAVASGSLSGDQFAQLQSRMGTKAAIEFISFVTWRIGILRTVQAHWAIVGYENDASTAFACLQEFLEGSRKPEASDIASNWVEKPE